MVALIQGVSWAFTVLVGVGFVVIAARSQRNEEFPGKTSFVAALLFMAVMLFGFVGVLVTGYVIESATNPSGLLPSLGFVVLFAAFSSALLAPLAWFRFGLLFTGQRIPTDRRTFIRIGLPVLVGLVAVGVFTVFPIVTFALGLGEIPDYVSNIVTGSFDYILKFVAFYLAALLVIGSGLIGWTSYNYRHLSTSGGALLAVGFMLPWAAIVIPWAANLFQDQTVFYLYHGMGGAVVGFAAVSSAVYRHQQLAEVPAAGSVGRDVTVEEMNDPVVVVDQHEHVLDLNPAAERTFDADDPIGTPLASILDGGETPADRLTDGETMVEISRGNNTYESTVSELRDDQGRLLGHSIVFHDITERKRREQRIAVLNRVLRHNLRNDLNTVSGYAAIVEEGTADPQEYLERIQERAAELIATGEKARQIEEIVASQRQDREMKLSEVIQQAVEEIESIKEECQINVDSHETDQLVNGPVLTAVLRELIENGCQHNDAEPPVVVVSASVDSSREFPLQVTVEDNGPGIPEHELAPIREGTETALEHGSGLGLWLVEWGVTNLQGKIEFSRGDARGTIATLHLPPSSELFD